MLHKETVERRILELLKRLQAEPQMQDFNLAGGTALSLRLGHRKSVDLDFFCVEEFDLAVLKEMLVGKYDMQVAFEKGQTIKGFIDDVMVDCIRYRYPRLEKADMIQGVRLESIPDIIAMKLSAIAQNGTRLKDFVDIASLSHLYSLDEMLLFYGRKFSNSNLMMTVKSLTYFDDIDFNESIVMMKGLFDWKRISSRLLEMTEKPGKRFSPIMKTGKKL